NSLLDKAEDPEKMIKLMMSEMEDTLIELKSSCATIIAAQKKIDRQISEAEPAIDRWIERAKLALSKNREDLAREALVMKNQTIQKVEKLRSDFKDKQTMIDSCKENIRKVEEKLSSVRVKYQNLSKNEVRPERKENSRQENDFDYRFNQMDEKLDKMGSTSQNSHLDKEFSDLEEMDEIDAELEALRKNEGKGKSQK
ncbi:MAG: phage shock protein A, partial [Spirochaetia bacterium]|nr:phage shock protein A [Spirochaetia bacterium]